jgi:uncharacterized protein (DUF58 family)
VRVHVRSTGLLLPNGLIHDPLLPEPVPLTPGHWEQSLPIDVTFTRRGRRRLAAPRVEVRDPFGLAVRTVAGADDEVLVLPAVLPVCRPGTDLPGDALGRRAASAGGAPEVELDGLRPLRAGTSAARISWAVWARTGELLERRLIADGDARPVIVLDTRTASGGEEEALDAAVRAAASLCVALGRREGCGLLLPGDRRPVNIEPGLGAWAREHARLALVGPGGSPLAGALTGRTGVVVYVSARALPRPPALTASVGAGQILVVPAAMPGRTAAFQVAGCLGYDLTGRGARRRAVA